MKGFARLVCKITKNLFKSPAIIGSVHIYSLDGKEISVELETLPLTDHFQKSDFMVFCAYHISLPSIQLTPLSLSVNAYPASIFH